MITALAVVASFVLGTRYGARVEKEAVTVALSAFTKAKAILGNVIVKSKAVAAAELARLEAVEKKYL